MVYEQKQLLCVSKHSLLAQFMYVIYEHANTSTVTQEHVHSIYLLRVGIARLMCHSKFRNHQKCTWNKGIRWQIENFPQFPLSKRLTR